MLKHIKLPHHVKRALVPHESGIEVEKACIRHASSGMLQALGVPLATSDPRPTLACQGLKYVSGTTTDLQQTLTPACDFGGELDNEAIACTRPEAYVLDLNYLTKDTCVESTCVVPFVGAAGEITRARRV
jgi:hypothetical protein